MLQLRACRGRGVVVGLLSAFLADPPHTHMGMNDILSNFPAWLGLVTTTVIAVLSQARRARARELLHREKQFSTLVKLLLGSGEVSAEEDGQEGEGAS